MARSGAGAGRDRTAGPGGRPWLGPLASVVALLLALAACGPGGDRSPTPTAPTADPPVATVAAATPLVGTPVPAASPPSLRLASPIVPTQPPGPPIAPPPGGTTAEFRSERAELGPVVWASGVDPATNAPRDRVGAFSTGSPVIQAAVPVSRLARGTVLSAVWSYNGTPLPLPPSQVVAERDEEETWVEFHLPQPGGQPWPAGVYAIEVQVDGQPAQAAAVLVEG